MAAQHARIHTLLATGFARAQDAISRDTALDVAGAVQLYKLAAAALLDAANLAIEAHRLTGQHVLPAPHTVAALQQAAAQYTARANTLAGSATATDGAAAPAAPAASPVTELEAAANEAFARALQLDEAEHPTMALQHYTAAVERFLQASAACTGAALLGKRRELEQRATSVRTRARCASTEPMANHCRRRCVGMVAAACLAPHH